ncbi:MAG: universal stress protein [Polyangiaceae bacterium]
MTRIDQFESVFLSSAKAVFRSREVDIRKVLVVTDLDGEEAGALAARLKRFLRALGPEVDFVPVAGDGSKTIEQLLGLVEKDRPGLICSYRNLHSRAWQWPHSLGAHLDVLTQATEVPILVIPHPKAQRELPHALIDTNVVMAVTDHLAGDDRLVSHAVHFTEEGGTLYLAHVEDKATFDRYMATIAKIASIDTETAEHDIREQLLKEPHDYIRSCREKLEADGAAVKIEEIVTLGSGLREYLRRIEEHKVDLLVMNTKEDGQLAMHGMAYPLAVELRQIPLLML